MHSLPGLPPGQVRAYLRNRRSCHRSISVPVFLNQGHRTVYEWELVYLHDRLPKDAGVHDGLQLVDGGAPSRHDTIPAPDPVAGTAAATSEDAPAAAAPVGVALHGPRAPPPGPVIPGPPAPLHLAPLPAHSPVLPGSQASRQPATAFVRQILMTIGMKRRTMRSMPSLASGPPSCK